MNIEEQAQLDLIRELSFRHIEKHAFDELQYFDIAWEQFILSSEQSRQSFWKRLLKYLQLGGLEFEKSQDIDFETIGIIMEYAHMIRKVADQSAFETFPKALKILLSMAKVSHAQPFVIENIKATFSPEMFNKTFTKVTQSDPIVSQSEIKQNSNNEEDYYIDRMVNGVRYKNGRCEPKRSTYTNQKNDRYDIFVDEYNKEYLIRPKMAEPESYAKISKEHKRLMWLAMTKFGELIEYEEVKEKLGMFFYNNDSNTFEEELRQEVLTRISKFKTKYEMEKQIFMPESNHKKLSIQRNNWGFCWIRQHKDPMTSDFSPSIEE